MKANYRSRIYGSYLKSWQDTLAPSDPSGFAPRAHHLRRLILNYFPKDKNAAILDLGCGHGAIMYFAREAGYANIRGVDGSMEQVTAARRLGIEHVEQGDILDALRAQADSSLDVVIAFDLIEHFTRDELLVVVDAVNRVLSPGGRWIIHVPNGESPFFGGVRYGDFTHELAFTRTSIKQLLLTSGFAEVWCHEDSPVPHGIKSAIRAMLWKGIRAMLRFCIAVETGDMSSDRIFSQNFYAIANKQA